MGVLELAQQLEQGLGFLLQLVGQDFDGGQLGVETVLLLAREAHAGSSVWWWPAGELPHTGC